VVSGMPTKMCDAFSVCKDGRCLIAEQRRMQVSGRRASLAIIRRASRGCD
jgi:hypothetical protein